ncbi:MAG: hypothetical protein MZV70_40390 [Desulfobacterales bacterium]|nr:hypothetical protein [Desulfobacterales bacterium]
MDEKSFRPGIHPTNRPPGRHRHGAGHEKSRRQMIRINLLPFRSARKKENIRRQLSIFLLSLVLDRGQPSSGSICCLSSQVDDLNSRIASTQAELEKYDKINREIEEIKKKLDNLNKKMDGHPGARSQPLRAGAADGHPGAGDHRKADVVHRAGRQSRRGQHQRRRHGRQDRGRFHGSPGRQRVVLRGQPRRP